MAEGTPIFVRAARSVICGDHTVNQRPDHWQISMLDRRCYFR